LADLVISSIRIHRLEGEIGERFGWSLDWTKKRRATMVEVRTADGITGWGEGTWQGAERMLGRSAFELAALWEESRRIEGRQQRRGPARCAGIDIALWDIVGRALGQPVCKLLGSVYRTKVEAYCTALYRKDWPDLAQGLAEEAAGWVKAGFRNIKMKIGYDPVLDVRITAAVRDAVGPEIGLGVDSNCAYDAGTAIAMARRLEAYYLLWWEEPLPYDDLEGYARLKRQTSIPIAAGETETADWLALHYVQPKRVDILQPDLEWVGLTGFHQLNHLCWLNRIRLIPHNWGTALRTAATLHAVATCPPLTEALNPPSILFEFDCTESPFREAVIRERLDIDPLDSCVPVPMGAGLGVEVIPDEVARFRVEEKVIE